MKMNKIILNEDLQIKISQLIEPKNFNNAEIVTKIANIFNFRKCFTLKSISFCFNTLSLNEKTLNSLKLKNFLFFLNKMYPEDKTLVANLKKGKSTLNAVIEKSILDKNKNFEEDTKDNMESALYYYPLAFYFSLNKLFASALNCIIRDLEICYVGVFRPLRYYTDFMKLDFEMVAEIFASSKIKVEWNREVLEIANEWICYDRENREKLAFDLLKKVNRCYLSVDCLSYLRLYSNCFNQNKRCVELMNELMAKSLKE